MLHLPEMFSLNLDSQTFLFHGKLLEDSQNCCTNNRNDGYILDRTHVFLLVFNSRPGAKLWVV